MICKSKEQACKSKKQACKSEKQNLPHKFGKSLIKTTEHAVSMTWNGDFFLNIVLSSSIFFFFFSVLIAQQNEHGAWKIDLDKESRN